MTTIAMSVQQMLDHKGGETVFVAPNNTVFEALELMARHEIGAVLVLENERLVGIFTERDYARKVVLQGRSSSNTPVRDIMTAKVVTVRPDDSVDHCMQVVTEHRIRHLPVAEGDAIVGVISIGDLVKAVIEDQKVELDQLQRYIAS